MKTILKYLSPGMMWMVLFFPMFFSWAYMLNNYLHGATSGGVVELVNEKTSLLSNFAHVSILSTHPSSVDGITTVEVGGGVLVTLFMSGKDGKIMRWEVIEN